jgi:hypothetical protein
MRYRHAMTGDRSPVFEDPELRRLARQWLSEATSAAILAAGKTPAFRNGISELTSDFWRDQSTHYAKSSEGSRGNSLDFLRGSRYSACYRFPLTRSAAIAGLQHRKRHGRQAGARQPALGSC